MSTVTPVRRCQIIFSLRVTVRQFINIQLANTDTRSRTYTPIWIHRYLNPIGFEIGGNSSGYLAFHGHLLTLPLRWVLWHNLIYHSHHLLLHGQSPSTFLVSVSSWLQPFILFVFFPIWFLPFSYYLYCSFRCSVPSLRAQTFPNVSFRLYLSLIQL